MARRPVRILLLSLHFAPDTVSNAVVITELAEELAERGHDVTVVAAMPYHQGHRIESGYQGRLWSEGWHGRIRVLRTWILLLGNKQQVRGRMLAYGSFNLTSTLVAAFSGRHDIVITPSPPLTIGLCGWLLSRIWRGRFIYNVQDIYPDAAIKLGLLTSPWAIRFFYWLERFVYARADIVTVLSDGFRQNLIAKGVPEHKIAIIPNGVDETFIRPLPRDNQFSRENALRDRFVVLYAGNIGLAQGLDVLVQASLHLTAPNIEVMIVGSGADLPAARAHADEIGARNVRFLPFQPRERVPEVYASADVGVVVLRPGMGNTSVPSKLYSIMAAGKPVVAAVDPDSEVWRVVHAAGCGVCVPPGEPVMLAQAIEAFAVDPDHARRLGENGRHYIERHHSRYAVGEQYHELLRDLVRLPLGRARPQGGRVGHHVDHAGMG